MNKTNDRSSDYVESDLVYKVTGCAMAVLNEIGHGLREKTYERALQVEFQSQGINYDTQKVFPVYYKDVKVDEYIPDLIAEEKLILELKTVESITDEHIGQVLNYLRVTELKVGIILNFKHPKLQWKKIVLTERNRR